MCPMTDRLPPGQTPRCSSPAPSTSSTAPEELERILTEGLQAGDRVELDLGGVEFIDSSGISMLIEARRQFDSVGRVLVVVNPSKAVLRLLVLTGLTEAFGIVNTPADSSER